MTSELPSTQIGSTAIDRGRSGRRWWALGALALAGLSGHLGGLPAHRLAPHAFAAARDAYASGMSEVMLVSAAVLATAAVLVALFLPARASAKQAETVAREPLRVRHSTQPREQRA